MFNREFSENEKEYLDQKFKQLTEDFMSGRLIYLATQKNSQRSKICFLG
ncbi:Protein of unknown function [Lactobacillus hominis DSM 23910 = CRBIP 24.179]|uniref:Uncharacterized protein n=1 Tax=Lactobacillus hominis DSM 23910 = CRBIP 24.179 TaxID=1423758 RepID=I7L9P9_9LACO|nr:Protein of unknown function [Lactobacillus hominis DSM 23910 = CRBIP 24.179]